MTKCYALVGDGRLLLPPSLTKIMDDWEELDGWEVFEAHKDEYGEASEFAVVDGTIAYDPTSEQQAARDDWHAQLSYEAEAYGISKNTDESICKLYEDGQSASDVQAEQDQAICKLYEMIIGGES